MANVSLSISNENAVIYIEGSAVIDSATQLHKIFKDAFDCGLPVILNLDKTTDCDLSFIQLIGSLCYSLHKEGRALNFYQNNIPVAISESIKTMGFHFRCKCTRIINVECLFATNESCFGMKQELHR